MKKGTIWILLTCLIVTSLVLASCTTKTTTSTPTSTTTKTTTTTTKTTTTATTPTTTPTTTTATGNWWDSLGTPQYGGTLTDYSPLDFGLWDPANSSSLATLTGAYMQGLYGDNWALNPATFDFSTGFRPPDYVQGLLADTWEFTGPGTYVVHLR